MEAKHILVIGGGIAGLTAAIDLARARKRVTLLEAADRLGGRIFTRHDKSTPIELGAEFIHGGSKDFWKLIRSARLKSVKVPNRFQRHENGALKKMDLWHKVEKVMEKIDPDAPDKSFSRFLAGRRFPKETKTLVTNFVEGFDAADPRRIGVHGLAAAGEEDDGDPGDHQFRVERGYSALISYLERQARLAGVRIQTRAPVKTVSWRVGHVQVTTRHEVLRAGAAIITLPLGVLKTGSVRFHPPLREKKQAIDGLQFGNVVKVVLKFNRTLWPKDFGFIIDTAKTIPTWWSDRRGPILIGWVGGPKADALKSKSQLEKETIRCVTGIFGIDPATIRASLLKCHIHDWRRDPFIGGAYSYVPVNGIHLPNLLAAPMQNTLYFAGEATVSDRQPGTVHGAWSSGRRAARELLAADSN